MTDVILDVVAQLGEGLRISLRLEDGVIAKSTVAPFLFRNCTTDDALEEMLLPLPDERDCGAELRLAVCHALQFVQQLAHIGFRIVAFAAGITSGIDTRCTSEGLHFESRIVGKTVQSVVAVNVCGLLGIITLQRIGGFGDVGIATDILQTQNLYSLAQYRPDLIQFVGVIGGKH